MKTDTIAAWHRIVETRDDAALNALLAENAMRSSKRCRRSA